MGEFSKFENCDEIANSPIGNFYNNRSVFITGATGFMGKVLVEKLLRSTKVMKVFLLIRQKKGVPSEVRLQQLLSAAIFDKVKESCPDLLSRVEAVSGDISLPGFGLSQEDERKMTSEVSVIFHSAATIKFDEELPKALNLNVEAVIQVMELGKKMKKLEALIHVSTAYCNPQMTKVPEEICQENGDPLGMINLCKMMEPGLVNSMTPQIIGNKPNTYTYTKALGESVLQLEGGCLPIAIVRPSIVVASWKEPLPGWIENLNGPTGIVAGTGKGVMRTMVAKKKLVLDLIPVDIPINLILAVAWKTATCSSPSNSIPVYNCTSGSTNPITCGQFERWGMESIRRFPFEDVYRYPTVGQTQSPMYNKLCQVFSHTIPAHVVDMGANLFGGKGGLVRAVKKMHAAQRVLEFFTTHEWEWADDNIKSLRDEMVDEDKKTFNFDIADLNWPTFLDEWTKGTRQYLFKEPLSSLPKARGQVQRLYWIETMFMILMACFCLLMVPAF